MAEKQTVQSVALAAVSELLVLAKAHAGTLSELRDTTLNIKGAASTVAYIANMLEVALAELGE